MILIVWQKFCSCWRDLLFLFLYLFIFFLVLSTFFFLFETLPSLEKLNLFRFFVFLLSFFHSRMVFIFYFLDLLLLELIFFTFTFFRFLNNNFPSLLYQKNLSIYPFYNSASSFCSSVVSSLSLPGFSFLSHLIFLSFFCFLCLWPFFLNMFLGFLQFFVCLPFCWAFLHIYVFLPVCHFFPFLIVSIVVFILLCFGTFSFFCFFSWTFLFPMCFSF